MEAVKKAVSKSKITARRIKCSQVKVANKVKEGWRN